MICCRLGQDARWRVMPPLDISRPQYEQHPLDCFLLGIEIYLSSNEWLIPRSTLVRPMRVGPNIYFCRTFLHKHSYCVIMETPSVEAPDPWILQERSVQCPLRDSSAEPIGNEDPMVCGIEVWRRLQQANHPLTRSLNQWRVSGTEHVAHLHTTPETRGLTRGVTCSYGCTCSG